VFADRRARKPQPGTRRREATGLDDMGKDMHAGEKIHAIIVNNK
jgi:hypothetical protein